MSSVHDAALLERWQAAWPEALAIWSRYTRLQPALLCSSVQAARAEGLNGSFAMIRFADQRVVIDLATIARLGLDDYALEVLAHEIGHHVLAPANATDHLRLLARMRQALPTLTQHAPLLANLYTDLLINDRLQRQSALRLADIYRKLADTAAKKDAGRSPAGVWALYMRIYEQLWQLEAGSLCRQTLDARAETDAWLGARLLRVYARDWLEGAGRFAALMLPYLLQEDAQQAALTRLLHDTESAGRDCTGAGLGEVEPGEISGAIHPAEDPLITGEDAPDTDDAQELDGDGLGSAESQPTQLSGGQTREPFEYGEILRAAGVVLDAHEIAIRYYHERALPHLLPYPRQRMPAASEPLPEGLNRWECADPLDELDWLQSVLQSPTIVPGLSTVKRDYGEQPSELPTLVPIDLDIYVDSSGSMPDPRQQTSWLTLAGAIIALSALRAGASVQVTLWSGKDEVRRTAGFVRDTQAILAVLTDFFGGATAFPIHCLRDTYADPQGRARPTHLLMISDEGIDTLFAQDEQGNEGWDIAACALARAGAGGTLALNLPEQRFGYVAKALETIDKAVQTQGWALHAISDWAALLSFAQDFSRRHRHGLIPPTPMDPTRMEPAR